MIRRLRLGRGTAATIAAAAVLLTAGAWAAARLLRVPQECVAEGHIAVLAGGRAYPERTDVAAGLHRISPESRVILTNDGERGGWSRAEQRNPRFVELAAARLQAHGVPAELIDVLPGTTSGTWDEAARLRGHADSLGLAALTVVTSVHHGRRTALTFDHWFRNSPTSVRLCALAEPPSKRSETLWWLDRRGWSDVAGEYPKLAGYALRRWRGDGVPPRRQ
jgi:uncharacterized SAM-binding protein YcdF (DUF218 family)